MINKTETRTLSDCNKMI